MSFSPALANATKPSMGGCLKGWSPKLKDISAFFRTTAASKISCISAEFEIFWQSYLKFQLQWNCNQSTYLGKNCLCTGCVIWRMLIRGLFRFWWKISRHFPGRGNIRSRRPFRKILRHSRRTKIKRQQIGIPSFSNFDIFRMKGITAKSKRA